MYKKESYVVSAAIVVAVITMLFFPVTGTAADPAALSPILQKLDQIPPTWSKTLTAAERFELVLGDAGVLDKETGLVWEKSPSTTQIQYWLTAVSYCQPKNVGGRNGWRFPTVDELASLVDISQSNPALPSGHPFINVQSYYYWTATTSVKTTSVAWSVHFGNGKVSPDSTIDNYVWCVRGGQGYDAR